MLTKNQIIEKAHELDFEDVGITTAEPFESQKAFLIEKSEEYSFAAKALDLVGGTDPKKAFPKAKSIIVLMEMFYKKAYPRSMEKYFGRCYQDDDRMTHDGLALRIRDFVGFLSDNGIGSQVPFNLPHRMAAARAGLGSFGKNCLFYSRKAAKRGSWVLPIAVVVDHELEPDEPVNEVGCPDWCKNTCVSACPTGALRGAVKIAPRICISYLTYFGPGPTPEKLREPMGMWVYGCDVCQNVCPRNAPWLATDLPINERVVAKADNFELTKLLHMDTAYFTKQIWPHMFYMPPNEMWRWKMNAARAMGNSLDTEYVPHLKRAIEENDDERILSLAIWALGRIGGSGAQEVLEGLSGLDGELLQTEIKNALERA